MYSMGAYFGTRQLVEYADSWQLVNARIRLVTQTQAQANGVQDKLFRIAQNTRNSMEATAVLYQRLALGANELGRSHQELLDVTEAVNAGMLVSGATGVEAAQSMRQLSQAFSKGKLDGDEFRTVMEAMPSVAQAIAAQLKVTRGELLLLAPQGKITANTIITALLAAHDKLVEQAKTMPITIGQSMILFKNAIERLVGIMSMALGVGRGMGKMIGNVAENIHVLLAIVVTATAAWLAYETAILGAWMATQLMLAGEVVMKLYKLVTAVRALASVSAVWAASSAIATKGLLGLVAVAGIGAAAFFGYKKILEEITKMMDDWVALQDTKSLDEIIGQYQAPKPEVDKSEANRIAKIKAETEDMVILSQQQLYMARLYGRELARVEIVMDAINKTREAERDLTGELLAQRKQAIIIERDNLLIAEQFEAIGEATRDMWSKAAEDFKRFIENVQRGLGDVFFDIMDKGLKNFNDLFEGGKRAFYRMLADMLAADMVKKLTGTFAGFFNLPPEVAKTGKIPDKSPILLGSEIEEKINMGMKGTPIPVEVEAMNEGLQEKVMGKFAKFLGPALAGFMVGGSIGSMTSNTALGMAGGALGGAAAGFAQAGVLGAAIGGMTGAIGGFMGSSEKHRKELEAHRQVLKGNNQRLKELRATIFGGERSNLVSATKTMQQYTTPGSIVAAVGKALIGGGDKGVYEQYRILQEVAKELGITLDGSKQAWDQLNEALKLSIIAITQFGRNLTDIEAKQNAYNKIFGVLDTPQQRQQDAYSVLTQMAPELLKQMGLGNLNLDSPYAQEALKQGFKDIYNLIATGGLTPELLGAFTDKNQLLASILSVIDAFGELEAEVMKISTDFPRAMDIIYYEQKFGRYGAGYTPDPIGTQGGYQLNISGGITIINQGNETGEEILEKIENAAERKRARGGLVLLGTD